MKIGIVSIHPIKHFWFDGIEISTKIKTQEMSQMKQDMFGSIFGHSKSQRKNSKMKSNIKSGDIVEFRLFRQCRDSRRCTIERKYNDQNWETMARYVSTPCIPVANLGSTGDSVSFVPV